MNENERLEYTIDEFKTLIDEINLRINVLRQNNNLDIESKIQAEMELERKRELLKVGMLKPYFEGLILKVKKTKIFVILVKTV